MEKESVMRDTSLRGGLVSHCGEFMMGLFIVQPVLDVLSYFMQRLGATEITTALRTFLLIAVSLYGLFITENRRAYGICYGIIGGFWVLHMLNCLRVGYVDPVGDTAEYLKLVQFPLWTLSFITFFRQRENLDFTLPGIVTVNLAIILIVIFLSFVTGSFVFTYNYPERGMEIGLLGWFAVPNAQSAVLAMVVPAVLLWAFRIGKLWIYSVCCALGFGILYFTGTRLAFFSGIITALGLVALILWNREQQMFCIPLVCVLLLFIGFKGLSPMEARQGFSTDSNTLYQQKTDAVMGEDKDYVYQRGEEIPPEIRTKIERVYTEVYGVPGPYDIPLLGDLIEKFGLEAVMEAYDYTIKPEILYHTRNRKLKAMELTWDQQDFLTKLLGFEYAQATINGNIYDPENDFPCLLYYYGFFGAALYLGFAAYFLLVSFLAFIRNWRTFLTVEFGTAALMYVYTLAAAQFSGQALRKPSVCVYFSLAAALLYVQVYPATHRSSWLYHHNRQSVVTIRKI